MRGATYNIHGARVRVESDDGPALRSMMRLLDRFPQVAEPLVSETGSGSSDAAGACLSLRFGPRALAPPAGGVPLFRHGEVRALGERGRLWLTDGWSRLCVDALAGRAEGEVHPASWSREAEFEAYFLRLGLLELLRGQGRFPLEAAVLTAGKIAVLAAGGLDRGRPRVATEWCLDGPAPSGEVALLRLGPHGVLAGGWSPDLHPAPSEYPAPFSLTSSVRPTTPLLSSPARGGRMECRPQLLLFACEMPGETRVEPVLEREALAALIPASPLLLSNPLLATAHLETLRVLVRQCRCYRLLHGPDLFRRPQAMGDLIGALAAV